jgi:hypothetical protein
MKKPNRQRVVQLYLPQPGPRIPGWSTVLEKNRQQVVTLLVEMLRRHTRASAAARGRRHE